MRWNVLLLVLALLPLSYALDTNAISVVSPSSGGTVSGDFNVNWDVNNANADWNYFVISVVFGVKTYYDGDYEWNADVGTDFNTSPVFLSDGNYCNPDQNDSDVYHCSYLVGIDGNFLRDGPFTVKVIGWKTDNNVFESNSVSLELNYYNSSIAKLSGYSSSGDANVSITFECDVNLSSASFVFHTASGDVYATAADANAVRTVVLTISYPDLLKIRRGTVVEVNAGVASACPLPPDTNALVADLPDEYYLIEANKWSAVSIPYILDRNYPYLSSTLTNDVSVVARYTGTGWDTNVVDFFDENYTFEGYYFYADKNVFLPLRWFSHAPSSCRQNGDYTVLHAGWNFITVRCIQGVSGGACADSNSSLVTVSFIEANTGTNELYVTVRPLYQYYAFPGSEGQDANLVDSYGVFSVVDVSPVWLWINPNWLSLVGTPRYYGNCVSVPKLP